MSTMVRTLNLIKLFMVVIRFDIKSVRFYQKSIKQESI